MKKVLRVLIPLLIVMAGMLHFKHLQNTRPQAKRVIPEHPVPIVDVIGLEPINHRITVRAMGSVIPAREVVLQPQVGGRIVEQHRQLVPGGKFSAGETITRIDPRDYELAIIQQQANVERAQFELQVEEGRQRIAQREWDMMHKNSAAPQTDQELALRKPHLRAARAALEAARSRLEQAKLNLERTTIAAPFNCFVQEEYINVGQVVSPQTRIATLVGTDAFWVQVSLPVERLSMITVPRTENAPGSGDPAGGENAPGSGDPAGGENAAGSRAAVIQSVARRETIRHRGRITRLLGDLDPVGRMARLLITVDDPLDLQNTGETKELPLMVGAYVDVEIQGATLRNVFPLPRFALHDMDRVWIMNGDDRLEIRPVKIAWRNEETIFISDGLQSGDRVVVSSLATAVPGMQLQTGK